MEENLIFFNKEGHQLNMNYDENNKMYYTSLFFDKNSTDTFKTQGIYTFEKIEGTQNTFNTSLNKFQVFNTNGFNFFPKYDAIEFIITNIESTIIDSNYNTKWVSSENIHKYFYTGMWCYFTGLDSYHNTDFDTINTNYQLFKILDVKKDKILVYTSTNNFTALPNFNITNAKIIPVDVIEVQQYNEPIWNDSLTNIYENKKISLISNTDNDGIYTISKKTNTKNRYSYNIPDLFYTPSDGDKIKINIQLKTSNILISDGESNFDNSTNTVSIPYVPYFIKIGDSVIFKEKSTSLNLLNQQQFIITNIDRSTNTLTFDIGNTVSTQLVDCYLYLASNIFSIESNILYDNNNLLSLPLTYFSIMNNYGEELAELAGGYNLEYNKEDNSLDLISIFTDNYSTISLSIININNVITDYTTSINTTIYDVTPLYVQEPLKELELLKKDSNLYTRIIEFYNIDNFGIKININSKNYYVPFNTDIDTTINDFVSTYQTELFNLGINISSTLNVLTLTNTYPNIPVYLNMLFGDGTIYDIKYLDINITNIKSQLLININEVDYIVPYNTSDAQTILDWYNTWYEELKLLGIIISVSNTIIFINILDPERQLDIFYNIGYIPKSGDLSILETLHAINYSGSVISGNEIICAPGLYNFLDYYSVGQKISINGSTYISQNKSFNIIGLTENIISLSYQGPFWNISLLDLDIESDFFIRYPKSGLDGINVQTKYKWTWKDTQINDMFLYDFSGTQLQPYTEYFPNYNGITPLCGENGEYDITLNYKPNTDINEISNPYKQQTIFDTITFDIPYINSNITNNQLEPDPMQIFIGYNTLNEGWTNARLYLEKIEDVVFSLTTTSVGSSYDDLFIFKDNYVEIQFSTNTIDFISLGFKTGQIIQFSSNDTSSDGQLLGKLSNNGIDYTIKEIYLNKLVFEENVIEETSVKSVVKNTLPFYDINGNLLYVNRLLNVNISVLPKQIAYFDLYGETEGVDIRHEININNKNLNILKLQDYFIFKEVDINENGIDWVLMNRKRKELIEIYPEIFNYLASYKSVIYAINFFGYNDLTFTEYFQNIDPENSKFGKLFNLELLNLLTKDSTEYLYSNLAYENYRNQGFRKTNLFSLNYKITDDNGNFINAYSLEEVKVKLLGLKRWLTENIIPIGTKILDINGKYKIQNNFILEHESYMTKNFRTEEYSDAISFHVTGYLQPISQGSNLYNISVQFISTNTNSEDIWFDYVIKTFNLSKWNNITYLPETILFHNNNIWINNVTSSPTDEPGINNIWEITTLDKLQNTQILRSSKNDLDPVSFSINQNIDPYFIVEVFWHSGYSNTKKMTKSYIIPNSNDNNINNYIINLGDYNDDYNDDFYI